MHTLHIRIDNALAEAFDALAPHALCPRPLPRGTCVDVARADNVVTQSILMWMSAPSLSSSPPLERRTGATSSPPSTVAHTAASSANGDVSSVSSLTNAVHVFVVMDALQAPAFLPRSRPSAHRSGGSSPAPSVVDVLAAYLDEVCDAVCETGSTTWRQSLPLFSDAAKGRSDEPLLHVKLHLLITPNALRTAVGDVCENVCHTNATAREASQLMAAAVAWSTSCRICAAAGSSESSLPSSQRTRETAALAHSGTYDEDSPQHKQQQHERPRYDAELGLCQVATPCTAAVHAISSLAHKLLSEVHSRSRALPPPRTPTDQDESSGDKGIRRPMHASLVDSLTLDDLRPDTQRKCEPSDFHSLYASMLTEVSSFSARKTMAAVSAFPTMSHLIRFIESSSSQGAVDAARDTREVWEGNGQQQTGPSESVPDVGGGLSQPQRAGATSAVYHTNYGESRGWNVVSDTVVDAIMTSYWSSSS